jgi:serine/threonine protein kinase
MEKYRVEKILGAGKQGSVALVSDLTTGKFYSMKKMENVSNRKDIESSNLERLKDVCSPNISCLKERIYDESTKTLYIVYDYIVGYNLEENHVKSLDLEDYLWDLLDQMIHALEILEKRKIAHRDVKSANIIYNPATKIFTLIDFGLSAYEDANKLVGSPMYISEEVVTAAFTSDDITMEMYQKSDLFAVGVSCFEIANLKPPFEERDDSPSGLNDFFKPENWVSFLSHLSYSLIYIIDHILTGKEKASTLRPTFERAKAKRNTPRHDLVLRMDEVDETSLIRQAKDFQVVYRGLNKKDLYNRLFLMNLIPAKTKIRKT